MLVAGGTVSIVWHLGLLWAFAMTAGDGDSGGQQRRESRVTVSLRQASFAPAHSLVQAKKKRPLAAPPVSVSPSAVPYSLPVPKVSEAAAVTTTIVTKPVRALPVMPRATQSPVVRFHRASGTMVHQPSPTGTPTNSGADPGGSTTAAGGETGGAFGAGDSTGNESEVTSAGLVVATSTPAPQPTETPRTTPTPPPAPTPTPVPVEVKAVPVRLPQVMARPKARGNPSPPYPDEARRKHQEGVVRLQIGVAANGRVTNVEVEQSSGFPLLDAAAMQVARRWEFEPAREGNIAVDASVIVPFRFRLEK